MQVIHSLARGAVPLGVHIMIDACIAPFALMNDAEALAERLAILAAEIGFAPLCDPVVRQADCQGNADLGLSGFILFETGHLSIHTFPARGFVAIDLYTCQDDIDAEPMVGRLKKCFMMKRADVCVRERGISHPAQDLMAVP